MVIVYGSRKAGIMEYWIGVLIKAKLIIQDFLVKNL